MAANGKSAPPSDSPKPIDSNIHHSDSDKFRSVVGIVTPKRLTDKKVTPTGSTCPEGESAEYVRCDEPNTGLYPRLCHKETVRHHQYWWCMIIIDLCYMAQIGFSAILTALGASKSSFIVITIFGALNVAVAGVLALFKGLGLPMRLRKDWMEFQKLRLYIENQERMIEMGLHVDLEDKKSGCQCECPKCHCGPHGGAKCNCADPTANHDVKKPPEHDEGKDNKAMSKYVEKEIQKIQKMYNDMMATVENNQPDFYATSGASGSSKS